MAEESFWKRLGNMRITTSAKTLAGVESIGMPNTGAPGVGDDNAALDLTPTYSKTTTALPTTRASIPALKSTDELIKFIQQIRNQTGVRAHLDEIASQVLQGFRIKGSKETTDWYYKMGIHSKVHRAVVELLSVGWCVMYVSEDKKTLPNLSVFHNVAVKRGLDGNERIWLQVDNQVKTAIEANGKFFPSYWKKELWSQFGIDISRVYDKSGALKQGGAYLVSLHHEAEDTLPVPPLYGLMEHIMDSHRMMNDIGAISERLNLVLTQITVGNDLGQDMRNGKPRQVEQERLLKIRDSFLSAKKTGSLMTPADVILKYIFPASNPFQTNIDTVKVKDGVVMTGLGLKDFQNVPSEGAAAYLARTYMPKIDTLRQSYIEPFLRAMLVDVADRVPGADTARIIWDRNSMGSMTDRVASAKFRWATGGCSLQEINEEFNPDYDVAVSMALKQDEQQYKDVVPLLWEPSQGLSSVGMDQTSATPPTTGGTGKGKTPSPTAPASKGGGDKTNPTGDGAGRPPK